MPFRFGRGKGRGGGGRGKRLRAPRGLGWFRLRGLTEPPETCICPKCDAAVPHRRGLPCFQTKCPNCGTFMIRQFFQE